MKIKDKFYFSTLIVTVIIAIQLHSCNIETVIINQNANDDSNDFVALLSSTYRYHRRWRSLMGSRPCPDLAEWVLPQKPQGWPMTARTVNCLFSDSVAKRRKNKCDLSRRQWLESKLAGKKWIIYHAEPANSHKLSFTTPAGRLVAIVIHTVSKATEQ